MAKADTKPTVAKSAVTAEVVKRFEAWWTYAQSNHHPRWDRNRKLYNNKRVNPSYEGTTNTFVPLTYGIVETAVAEVANGKPSIDFVPQDMYIYIQKYYETGKKPDLKALNAQFDYYWDCDNWDLKGIKTARTGFLDGIAGEWIYWDSDKPRIINMTGRDMIIDPNLSDPMQLITNPNAYFTGRRFMTTKQALKDEKIVDPETGKLKPRYMNLRNVKPGFVSAETTQKQKEEIFIGALGDQKDLIEVLEVWDGKTIRSVANRSVEIEDRENKLGIHCLAISRFIADESFIVGKSIVDPIAAPQELVNDVTNQSVDAVTEVLSPQYELDPMYKEYANKVTNKPGVVYPFPPGTLGTVKKDRVDASAFNERQNIKNEIREATGIEAIVAGGEPSGDPTATEINSQQVNAGRRFGLYMKMFEKEALYQRAKIVYRMMLYYIKDKQLVPTTSMDGPKFHAYDPQAYDATYEPKIQLEANVKNSKRQLQDSSTMAYQALIADPTNDLWEAKKVLYPKMFDLTEEELDRIIGSQKPEAMGAEMGAPMGAPADPMAMPAPGGSSMSEARNYSPQQVAQMARDFLTTPFGEYYLEALSLKYNELHQLAEDETISAERKAFMIERSAGIKLAINYLIERRDALDAGMVPEDKKPA